MASIIEGFSYDIFISYRQKDNKYDSWITEFVDNLKKELEATFKEDVSVYFDINPHDGLLETHDVDASLKDKLKCLVFIPIISRTYCDPKSFAWDHEFRAFIDQASADQFGLKVRLPNGNVTNRVLPVRIYDLDNTDVKLCESVLGGVLRGIEFVYKSTGVNRPLRANEDHPHDNLNKTYYRDQINKVANSIKEVITAIEQYRPQHEEVLKEVSQPIAVPRKNRKTTIIAGAIIVLVLIVLGIFFIPELLKPSEKLDKSIAVLPFTNDNPSDTNNPIINGINRDISGNLQSIKDIRVISHYFVNKYGDPTKYNIREIAKELNVSYLVTGSGQKYETNLVLRVELIDAKNDRTLWSKPYQQEIRQTKDIYKIQSEMAQNIAMELHAVITPEEEQLIKKTPTVNLTAYDFYQRGKEEYQKYWLDNDNVDALEKAEVLYHKSLEYDSTFAQVYTGLARVYWDKHKFKDYLLENFQDSAIGLCDIALSFDHQLSDAYTLKGTYYSEIGKPEEAIEEFNKAIKFNPNDWMAYYGKGNLYSYGDLVNWIDNYQKAASLNRGPELPALLFEIGWAYYSAGYPEKAMQYYQDKLKLDGDSAYYYAELARYECWLGNFNKSIEFGVKSNAIDSTNVVALLFLGNSYVLLGRYEESLKYYKKWIERSKTQGDDWVKNAMHRVGYAFWINGFKKEAEHYFDEQINYCTRMIDLKRLFAQTLYTYYDLAGVYAFRGDRVKAYENLRIFNQRKTEYLWTRMLIKTDPLFNGIRNEPEFQQIVRDVEAKYQAEHERVSKWLEEKGML
jgi:TolB-like protein/Tfp pilus assembly protein PilF